MDSLRRVLFLISPIGKSLTTELYKPYTLTMFIAIVGTPSAGKRSVLDYLVDRHGFQQVGLDAPKDQMEASKIVRSFRKGQC